ncbi:hypothetical protein [Planotetraspora mira]|uniref:Uncharacterized protein n=1 Tax=Planotetraspora mira TaxID=58121 RepID=A0A8J3XF53_9ACTN|nr:hypothetical protein [Planotetraspora mira]GII34158.1 hypothetical protein Pmi06nite_76000 [Planotetraspora mira]
MIEGLFDRAASLLERRFLKNAFLPVLLVAPAAAAPALVQEDLLARLIRWWDGQATTVQFLFLLGYFVTCWFSGAIVASQWRNIIRLYEGYPTMRWRPISRPAVRWHRGERRRLASNAQGADYRTYRSYPRESDILPTRLGNVIRAAETYPWRRYGVDTITIWPRIYRVLPQSTISDIQDARATLEFLLVLSLWFVTVGVGNVVFAAVLGTTMLGAVLVCGIASFLSYLTYVSAIPAAVEYGEQLRSAFDAHRLDLLARYRAPFPRNLDEERKQWAELMNFIVSGTALGWIYDNQSIASTTEMQ